MVKKTILRLFWKGTSCLAVWLRFLTCLRVSESCKFIYYYTDLFLSLKLAYKRCLDVYFTFLLQLYWRRNTTNIRYSSCFVQIYDLWLNAVNVSPSGEKSPANSNAASSMTVPLLLMSDLYKLTDNLRPFNQFNHFQKDTYFVNQ